MPKQVLGRTDHCYAKTARKRIENYIDMPQAGHQTGDIVSLEEVVPRLSVKDLNKASRDRFELNA